MDAKEYVTLAGSIGIEGVTSTPNRGDPRYGQNSVVVASEDVRLAAQERIDFLMEWLPPLRDAVRYAVANKDPVGDAPSFAVGQRVLVLVPTLGAGDDDEEHEYPANTEGYVCLVEGGRVHVEIGEGEAQITQVFDSDELPTSLKASPEKIGLTLGVNGNDEGREFDTLDEAATAAADWIRGINPKGDDADFRVYIHLNNGN